jgi:hypothetical protein
LSNGFSSVAESPPDFCSAFRALRKETNMALSVAVEIILMALGVSLLAWAVLMATKDFKPKSKGGR